MDKYFFELLPKGSCKTSFKNDDDLNAEIFIYTRFLSLKKSSQFVLNCNQQQTLYALIISSSVCAEGHGASFWNIYILGDSGGNVK